VPAIARLDGAQGASFVSRLTLLNASLGDVRIELKYTPRADRAAEEGGVRIASLELPGGVQIQDEDPLTHLFGFPPGEQRVGSLGISLLDNTARQVLGHCVIEAITPQGRFGQLIPAIRAEDAITAGQTVSVPTTVDVTRYRVNLGAAAFANQTTVRVRLVDAVGAPLADAAIFELDQGESIQLNDLFSVFSVAPQNNAQVEMTVFQGSAAAYGSVLDGVGEYTGTSDPTTMLPIAGISSRITFTELGTVAGFNDYRASASLKNHSAYEAPLEIRFIARDGTLTQRSATIPPATRVGYQDVITDLIGLDEGVGTIQVRVSNDALISGVARSFAVFEQDGEQIGTAGQLVMGKTEDDLLQPDRTYHFLGLRHRELNMGTERTHMSLFNPGEQDVDVTLTLVDGLSGDVDGTSVFSAAAGRLVRLNGVLETLAGEPDSDVKRIEVSVTGPIHATAYRVNEYGDPVSIEPEEATSEGSLLAVDVSLPSQSTGSAEGTLAVRVYSPTEDKERFPEGAPVLIWGAGGTDPGSLHSELPAAGDDIILITFLFPGGTAPRGFASDGFFDDRGGRSIQALRDVILFAAGLLTDSDGNAIDDLLPVPVLHDNIGLIGVSNGGNIVIAVAAEFGELFDGFLKYIVQWETPVSSQVLNRDIGRVWLKPSPVQGDYVNPRYLAYGSEALAVDYSDLAVNPQAESYRVFHDGNGDGVYTTVADPATGLQIPDLDLDGVLTLDEDFPLDSTPDQDRQVYSRPVTQALADQGLWGDSWPLDVATVSEAAVFWDRREAVRLYTQALIKIPDLEGMVIAGVRDHVQSAPDKPHIRQALEGWLADGSWVQLNPSPAYVVAVDPELGGRTDLPDNAPNSQPMNWNNVEAHCIPEDIVKTTAQLAAVWQMADRAQGSLHPVPPGSQVVTHIESAGIGRIAVRVEAPAEPRYPDGAPVVVEVSTWFTDQNRFHRVNATTRIGVVTISYLWPGRQDRVTAFSSEGEYDYGGPDSLTALRDVIRFAAGGLANVDGYFLHELVGLPLLENNLGLFASSHSGVVATNVLAHHGNEIPSVSYLVGRENPTRDEMYSLEIGHYDGQGDPIQNPFFDEDDYSPTGITVDYSSVGWYDDGHTMARPFFAAQGDRPEHVLHPQISAKMWGKRYYSRGITNALLDNGALELVNWPADLATPAEAELYWPYRISVSNYSALLSQAPNLRVMLVFCRDDHVQTALQKVHIRQAWDGFSSSAGLWVRLNPDRSYAVSLNPSYSAFPDNPAGEEPLSWTEVRDWGFPYQPGAREDIWLASVAEMADRVYADAWQPDLDEVIFPALKRVPHITLSHCGVGRCRH
jgi:hypothetical protein